MKHIILIVGSGPVGSFMAVLCAQLGFRVTVYEKRTEFTRNFNVKLEKSFFEKVIKVLRRLNEDTGFFENFSVCLNGKGIPVKELENKFSTEAKSLGAVYVTREVESFGELQREHKYQNAIILDCTGRNSKLRSNEFGPDRYNIDTTPLQYAMYINFRAKVSDDLSSLYQVMKYIKSIKLTEVVVDNKKDENGFSNVTLPVFITEKLARDFDREYPNINREPLKPFTSPTPVKDSIFLPISSLLGNLIIDGCTVDLNSVTVKKIVISCGRAKIRSRGNFVCLGDSAIHLAFFRSLNLGLKHALEFFIKLSMLQDNTRTSQESSVIRKFIEHNPHLQPIRAHPTVGRNVFLIVTKVIWYGCYSFCMTNHETTRLTAPLGVYESQIDGIRKQLNESLRNWSKSLKDFETKRDEDVAIEILDNKVKSTLFDAASFFIEINGKSFIKISEFARAAAGKCSLYPNDFKFLLECFKVRRASAASGGVNVIRNLLGLLPGEFIVLKKLCSREDISSDEKIRLIHYALQETRYKKNLLWDSTDINVRANFILTLIKNEIAEGRNQYTHSLTSMRRKTYFAKAYKNRKYLILKQTRKF